MYPHCGKGGGEVEVETPFNFYKALDSRIYCRKLIDIYERRPVCKCRITNR